MATAKRRRSSSNPSSPSSVPLNSRRVVSTSTLLLVETVKNIEEDAVAEEAVVAIGHALPAAAVAPAKAAKAVIAHRPKVVVVVPTTAEAATVKLAVAAVANLVATESVVDADVPKTDPDLTVLPLPLKVATPSVPNTTTVVRAKSKDTRESLVRSITPWTESPALLARKSRERAVTGKEVPARTRTRRPLPPLLRKKSKEKRLRRKKVMRKRPRSRTRKNLTLIDADAKKRRRLPRKMKRPFPESTLLTTKPSRPRTSS